jgi:hypothetical protein
MGPPQAPDGSPHGRFAQLLTIVLGPPSTVLQYRGVGGCLQSRPQRHLLLRANAPWIAGNGLALQRARLTRLHHGTFHRIHADIKTASGFSHGLTVSHRSYQALFQVGRTRTHTCSLCTIHACPCFSQVAVGARPMQASPAPPQLGHRRPQHNQRALRQRFQRSLAARSSN